MPDGPTPDMLKRMKVDDVPSSTPVPPKPTNGTSAKDKGKAKVTTVQDADEDEEMDTSADFAPGGDADYFVEEDDEGRFFGGGLTDEQKTILNIFDKAGGPDVDPAGDDVCTHYCGLACLTMIC